ncbi:hypothetical protein [Sphingopyxis sp. JAI128]|uniref:hypothetical protein n=1 Tax=Sphingopyxis sp. JAI128 TaxID=2723066 RepID=UPI0017DC1899|nr:hypothetical protein [Sphingopyxis sp. JAI128]MBB6427077.1 putative membrane protein YphA (DoxX/SURF4 family) [Sphingopyxis sp. JAI128]
MFLAHGVPKFFGFPVASPMPLKPMLPGAGTIALYCFLFLFIATRGAGIWSVDGAKNDTARSRTARGSQLRFNRIRHI